MFRVTSELTIHYYLVVAVAGPFFLLDLNGISAISALDIP